MNKENNSGLQDGKLLWRSVVKKSILLNITSDLFLCRTSGYSMKDSISKTDWVLNNSKPKSCNQTDL